MTTNTRTTFERNTGTIPEIPGLIFRKFRSEADYPAMAELVNTANIADGEDYLSTVEEIRNTYNNL
ncbi:MAG: hypothetical protein ABFS17_09200, partial [Chloroflexota bacterium]